MIDLACGDSLDLMRALSRGSVDGIVTSPPYANVRPKYGGAKPDEYADWLAPFLAEMLRVVTPEGGLMLNLGRVFRDGEESGYLEETLLRARDLGWKRLDTIIWRKTKTVPVGGRYLHNVHEYVYWLAPSTRAYRGYDAETRTAYTDETLGRVGRGAIFRKDGRDRKGETRELHPDGALPKSVVTFTPGRTFGIAHGTPMALDLARLLVRLVAPPGAVILDPFVGSGTTLVAALESGRRGIGYDSNPDAYREARERVQAVQTTLPVRA